MQPPTSLAYAMTTWNSARRVLVVVGCAWLGAPVLSRMGSLADLAQPTPLYAAFAVVQVALLACAVGALRHRSWVTHVLLWCAITWTVAIPAWVATSPLGLVSLLLWLRPAGIAGASGQLNAAAAAPIQYAISALIYLWLLALIAWAGRRVQHPPQEHASEPERWANRLAWIGMVAAALHVTVWPMLQRSALLGNESASLRVELTPAQRRSLSTADQRTIVELNEDLDRISQRRPPLHAHIESDKYSTWYRAHCYEIAVLGSGSRMRQVEVILHCDLTRAVREPQFFVDWPVTEAASGAASAP
jgi:hypothetical protein